MEAGGSSSDIQFRMQQYGEMRSFIDSQYISSNEAVIIAGDLNTSMNIKYYTCDATVKKFHKTGGTINSVRPMDPRPKDSDAFYRRLMEYGAF